MMRFNAHPTLVTPRLSLLRILVVAFSAFLFVFIDPAASAQFSGPAISSSTLVNRPLTPTTDPAILYPQGREIHLAAGDVIGVHVYGAVDYAPSATVSLDGSVQLPLIGAVAVEGLTIPQAQARIASRLVAEGMYRDPQVSIQLTESPNQVVTLSGEVHGIVQIRGQKRLIDVLAGAGGFPQTASHIITIHRPGVDQPIVVDLGTDPERSNRSNVPIFAGDTIIVPRIGVVYVLGAFKTQGAVPLQPNSPLTLMQVASLSGGPGFEGKYDDLRLIRTVEDQRKVVKVDIKRVINGKDPDPVLQVDDIVFLPSSNMKAVLKNGGIGTVLGIVSFLLFAIRP